MIRIFLKDLPYTLTQPMFREFEAKQRELKQWKLYSKSNRIKKYLEHTDIIEYVFAVGIYYRYVIAPLTRTEAFFERIKSKADAGLSIGGREVNPEYQKSIAVASYHFSNVLKEYGLSEPFFALTDVKQIVMNLIQIDENRGVSE